MKDQVAVNISSGVVVAMLVMGLFGSRWEKRRWNNGVCRSHGRQWIYFGADSQGGRGYRCGHDWATNCSDWQSWGWDCRAADKGQEGKSR